MNILLLFLLKSYYAGKLQMMPGNSAFYAKILPNIIFSFIYP